MAHAKQETAQTPTPKTKGGTMTGGGRGDQRGIADAHRGEGPQGAGRLRRGDVRCDAGTGLEENALCKHP